MVVYEDNLHKTLSKAFQVIWILLIILLILRFALRFFQGALGSADISPIVGITNPIYQLFENTAKDMGSSGFVVDLSAVTGVFVVLLFTFVISRFLDIPVYSGLSMKVQKSISAIFILFQSFLLLNIVVVMFMPEANSIFSNGIQSISGALTAPLKEYLPTIPLFRMSFESSSAVFIIILEIIKQILLFAVSTMDFTQKSPIKSDTIISHNLMTESAQVQEEVKEKPLNLELPAIPVTNDQPLYQTSTEINTTLPAQSPVQQQILPPIPAVPPPMPQQPIQPEVTQVTAPLPVVQPIQPVQQSTPLPPLPPLPTVPAAAPAIPVMQQIPAQQPLPVIQPIPAVQTPVQTMPVVQPTPAVPSAGTAAPKKTMPSIIPKFSSVQKLISKAMPKISSESNVFDSSIRKDNNGLPQSPLSGLPPLPRTVNSLPSNRPQQSSKDGLPTNPFRGS